jgi:hypothetical protein
MVEKDTAIVQMLPSYAKDIKINFNSIDWSKAKSFDLSLPELLELSLNP